MKNTLTIDMTNSYAVDMLSNVDAGVGVNRVYIEVKCDLTKTNTIAFGGTTYTATSDDYIVEIPQAQWVGTGNLIITLSDGTTTKSLTVHKLKAIDASVFLKRITDVEYTFKTSRNPTEASVGTLQEEVDSLKIRMGAAENVNAEQTRDIATNAGNISTNATNITALQNGKLNNSEKGAANGVATLNGDGKVPESQLPSYVDDVLEYASRSAFPGTGETGKLYIAKDTNIVYRWGGTTYVAVSEADIATTSKAGIVKPDGSTVTIDVDGTLHAQGGHKILNPEGTQLAQQTKLQFLNSEVQNVGDKTVVTPKGKADYEFETYQDMMDAIDDDLVEPDSTIYVMEGDELIDLSSSTFFGTCTTASAERIKVATINDITWHLRVGIIVGIKYTYTNTYNATAAAPCQLNVNGTGAKEMRAGNVSAVMTGTNTTCFGRANSLNYYMYDGTYWIWAGSTYDNNTTAMQSLGNGYGTCTTAAATAAKVVTLSGYSLMINGYVSVKFTNAVPANATMNINNRGAKNIFFKDAKIIAGIISAGDLVTFVYDGTQYRIVSIDSKTGGSVTIDSALSTTSTNPVQNKVINTALGNKVDKVSGKGLSTNDFTATYKSKLDGIASGATANKPLKWLQYDLTYSYSRSELIFGVNSILIHAGGIATNHVVRGVARTYGWTNYMLYLEESVVTGGIIGTEVIYVENTAGTNFQNIT